MRGVFKHPLTAKAVPSPYKQGESAVRSNFTIGKGYSLLLTTYRNSYFLSFFSPFTKKTLTNFNILCTCFVNYKGHPSAENTHNFSENTNNFSFSPNNFSDSPRNFTDFPAIFGIKKRGDTPFAEVSPRLYYKDNKFSSQMQIR